ncbi:recombinase family protein [Halobacteriovorax sp. JY17]|uniref:recombinase family protein n=1 Tax=Halobacteriovorax sp. JY17 TaxID=2014617 RepID=UPI000C3779B2|nr:recombinase family protein [Halobacteriovorax sp. JY17]PIK15098.1 MAG: hypothetical protein CES88_12250 [Halobacteriovorax sp. JY17]
MRKVAIYCRTSTNMQQNGLEAQKRALVNYCKSKSITNFIIYEDSGISGTKKDRPALNEMMNEVDKGNIQVVIVYSFSRFARSTKHLLEALDLFRGKKTEFISLSENIDTTTHVGALIFSILAALSEFERELIVDRVKTGILNARANGKQIGRPKTRNDELIISLRSKGYTYKQIRELLGVGHGSITAAIREADRISKKKK